MASVLFPEFPGLKSIFAPAIAKVIAATDTDMPINQLITLLIKVAKAQKPFLVISASDGIRPAAKAAKGKRMIEKDIVL